jgi:hypothetical protein
LRASPVILRALGVLLLLPLAATLVGSVIWSTSCDYDCGDQGGKGLFILLLLCTPLAAAGVLALAAAGRRSPALDRRVLVRLGRRAVLTPVLLCALLLTGTAVAALAGGVDKLTSGPQIHYAGDPDAGREQADEEGVFLLVVGGVLGLMAAGTAAALWAAWRMRR